MLRIIAVVLLATAPGIAQGQASAALPELRAAASDSPWYANYELGMELERKGHSGAGDPSPSSRLG
jgi:hypothetical protein